MCDAPLWRREYGAKPFSRRATANGRRLRAKHEVARDCSAATALPRCLLSSSRISSSRLLFRAITTSSESAADAAADAAVAEAREARRADPRQLGARVVGDGLPVGVDGASGVESRADPRDAVPDGAVHARQQREEDLGLAKA